MNDNFEIISGILIRCKNAEKRIVIPKNVIGIADNAFETVCESIEEIFFPETLLWIGTGAFKGCQHIRELLLPKSLVEISDYAFYGCTRLKKLDIPENVYRIGHYAFSHCSSLENVRCSEGLVKIGIHTFAACEKLGTIVLPRSCAYIDKTTFEGSNHVVIHSSSNSDAELYAEIMGIPFVRIRLRLTLNEFQAGFVDDPPDFVIRNGALVEYNGTGIRVHIPDSVTLICGEVFRKNLQIESVEFSSERVIVGTSAFSKCRSLQELDFSGSFLYLSDSSFSDCSALTQLIIDGGVHISEGAFRDNTALDTIIFPDTNVNAAQNAFYGCNSIAHIKLPTDSFSVGNEIFATCSQKPILYISCHIPDLAQYGDLSAFKISFYHFDIVPFIALGQYCKQHGYEMISEEIPGHILTYIGQPPAKVEDLQVKNPAEHQAIEASVTPIRQREDYKNTVPVSRMPELAACDILISDEVISGEQIMRQFMKYVIETISDETNKTGIVLHTGSPCFNTVLLALSAIQTLLLNTATTEDILDSLLPGDLVLYEEKNGPKKYIYSEKEGNNRIVLIKNNKTKDRFSVPRSQWHRITPYYGKSGSTSDAGLQYGKSRRREFFSLLLDIAPEQVPKVPNTSLVVLTSRAEATRLIHGTQLRCQNKCFRLSEIVTAAYYTEGDTYYFSGNPGKVDPVIKFTDNTYVARRLSREQGSTSVTGVLVLGEDYLRRSYSEVLDLLLKDDIRFRFGTFSLSEFEESQLLDETNNPAVFAVTPEYVNKYLDIVPDYLCSGENCTDILLRQQEIVRKRNLREEVIQVDLSEQDYFRIRKDILRFKFFDFDSDEKILFVQEAFSALNLLMTAVFPIDKVSDIMNKTMFLDRIQGLRKYSNTFYPDERKIADEIIESISILYVMMGEKPAKQDALHRLLEKYAPYGKKTALVVPKAYYQTILRETSTLCAEQLRTGKLIISTPTRFDSHRDYCAVIYLSNKYEKSFAPLRCFASSDVIGIMYGCEQKLFDVNSRHIKELYEKINSVNFFTVDTASEVPTIGKEPSEVLREDELYEYIEQVSNDYLSRSLERFYTGSQGAAISNITAVVGFETGERALLTRHYLPYVFNETSGEINRPTIDKLCVGDLMVFNTDYYGTRDIVDTILEKKLDSLPDIHELHTLYRLSNHWKKVLWDYTKRSGKKEIEIANELKSLGVTVSVYTILGWLDPGSHTVRPRDPAVFQQIGYLVNDNDLYENPDRFIHACSQIQKERNKILRDISATMVSILNGSDIPESVPEDIGSMIGELAQTYRIRSITCVDKNVPSGITNHPIDQFDV